MASMLGTVAVRDTVKVLEGWKKSRSRVNLHGQSRGNNVTAVLRGLSVEDRWVQWPVINAKWAVMGLMLGIQLQCLIFKWCKGEMSQYSWAQREQWWWRERKLRKRQVQEERERGKWIKDWVVIVNWLRFDYFLNGSNHILESPLVATSQGWQESSKSVWQGNRAPDVTWLSLFTPPFWQENQQQQNEWHQRQLRAAFWVHCAL